MHSTVEYVQYIPAVQGQLFSPGHPMDLLMVGGTDRSDCREEEVSKEIEKEIKQEFEGRQEMEMEVKQELDMEDKQR